MCHDTQNNKAVYSYLQIIQVSIAYIHSYKLSNIQLIQKKMESKQSANEQALTFSISTTVLHFTSEVQNLKITIKNSSLKTTSYELILGDQEHFKLVSTSRTFSLAPGISKSVTVKHIHGQHCQLVQRQALQARVRDCNGKSLGFQCKCPKFDEKKQQQIIQYPKTIDLGQFDQKMNFDVDFKNVSGKNLKISLQDVEDKNSSTQIIACSNKKVTIRNLTHDSILLSHQNLRFTFEVSMNEHGAFKQKINFVLILQEATKKFLKSTQIIRETNLPSNSISSPIYSIQLSGYSVSKKLIIKDQHQQSVTQIRSQILTGTTKSSHFFIQTQYHQDVPYSLQAYFQTDTPGAYAEKWNNLSIQFSNPSHNSGLQNKFVNSCKGIFKTRSVNKIQYRLIARYTVNDQNYVSKYSKIKFEDDSNALRMRNSQYSKKFEDIQIKIKIRYEQQQKKTFKSIRRNAASNQSNYEVIVPFKCTLLNPSLRCQITQSQQNAQTANIIIFNETKVNIPYNFPMHSLYRIINSNYGDKNDFKSSGAQSQQSMLVANKKQYLTLKWTKAKQRCPIFMEIPSFDLVLYQTRDRQMKQKNMISLPPSRRRPQTSISSLIKAKQKQMTNRTQDFPTNNTQILNRINSQPNFMNVNNTSNHMSRPVSSYPLKPTNTFISFRTARDQSLKKLQIQNTHNNHKSAALKKITIVKQLPRSYQNRNFQEFVPSIEDLAYLIQFDKTLKNTHPQMAFTIQVIDRGFLILNSGQYYSFDGSMGDQLLSNRESFGVGLSFNADIRYRIFGHNPIYKIRMSPNNIQNMQPFPTTKRQDSGAQNQTNTIGQPASSSSRSPQQAHQVSNLYQPPSYQILSKQIKMSFKQSKQQFQIVQFISIKNCSNQLLQVNCISIDNQFFKCKEPNSNLLIPPEQVGKFKIGFLPENTVRLSIFNRQPPKQLRRKAIVKGSNQIDYKDNTTTIRKQIKLLINKNIQVITCIGQIIQKSCSVKPNRINFTNCKYGASEIVQTMIITNTSSSKINFIIDNPSEVAIKPKTGTILPKSTQNCTVTFKPCKKISNYEEHIKIFIGGSHLQLVPLVINVQDPEIYIKEIQLMPQQNAICGTQFQQLNLQMTLINNNPSQSFIQINLRDTPLFLGYSKHYHSANSGLVLQNFIRCSQVIQDAPQIVQPKNICLSPSNSERSILSQDQLSQISNMLNNIQQNIDIVPLPQKCSITIAPNTFLIVPLTLRIREAKIGLNKIEILKNIATLVGFGEIKSPHIVKYNCNKTLLHISPYKQMHEIILTQSQRNYHISLKNMAGKMIQVRTQIKQLKEIIENRGSNKSLEYGSEQKIKIGTDFQNQPSIISTFKDINEYLKPELSIDLNISFLCFEAEKKLVKALYELCIFVKQCDDQQEEEEGQQQNSDKIKEDQDLQPYFSTKINVVMPEPFLQLTPNVLVMPTVGVNTWSRQSFFIQNNGYKQIFVKIKKPANVTFQLEYQIVSNIDNQKTSGNFSKQKNKTASRISNISSLSNQPKFQSGIANKESKMYENQLTKINNLMQVRVSFRSKNKISFKVLFEIEDNFNKKYEIPIVGTCTDSPFFSQDGGSMGSLNSSASFHSHQSFNSEKSFTSSASSAQINKNGRSTGMRKSNLQPIDIEDLLFLNNWIGSLIPQISNQSTFFYVWLTKVDNFIKFLTEFKINLSVNKCPESKIQVKKNPLDNLIDEKAHPQKLTLTAIFQQLKQQGFQLNSIRIELLQKADQLQWLNFMWFFLSKAIVHPNFLNWINKNLPIKQPLEMTYGHIQKNYQFILTTIMTSHLELKKEANHNKSIDWKYLMQNFEQLLTNFKHVESRRHLVLSLNVLYHKLNNIEQQVIEISEFQFVLNVRNPHNRKVRFFLQCNPKYLTCEQSSNKVLPSQTAHGYSFMAEQNEQIFITFSMRNYTANSLTILTKNVLDLMNIVMFNNIIWDPITIYQIRLKRKQDIIHHVNIQCETKSTQQWIYKFESKMTAQYRVFFENEAGGEESMRLLTGQPGYLKKGQSTTIRVVYNPQNMNKSESILKIVNTMVKQIFKIHGKPLPSSKIQYEKNLRIIQNQLFQQTVSLPWQYLAKPTPSNTTRGASNQKGNNAKNISTSMSSREQANFNALMGVPAKYVQENYQGRYSIKLYNLSNASEETNQKYQQCILKKDLQPNPQRKQLKLILNFKYEQLIRNLELIFQITNVEGTECKLIRLVIDVIPKPILIKAEIEAQFNQCITQTIRIPNALKISQSISVEYRFIASQNDIKKCVGANNSNSSNLTNGMQNISNMLQNIHKGLFEVVKVRNNEVIHFFNTQAQKLLDHIDINVRYSPNQNNCFSNNSSQQTNKDSNEKSNSSKNKSSLPLTPNQTHRKKTSNNNPDLQAIKSPSTISYAFSNGSNVPQLPYFYVTVTYLQSLYQITYLFKPIIKKTNYRLQMLTTQQSKNITHSCKPLMRYQNNVIEIENPQNYPITYEVETDLYQISGKNQITLKPNSVSKYFYDIFCMHMGKKQGKIRFKLKPQSEKQSRNEQFSGKNQMQFLVQITISQTASPPAPQTNNQSNPNYIPKGNCEEQGLKIYNQYFEITSVVRKPKSFTISLANLSDKQIQFEVKCDSQYLRPKIKKQDNSSKSKIIINKQSQCQLEIQYIPYFIGQRVATLNLYNPHQPEITYKISMVSEESIQSIQKQMPKVGENKPIEICIINPSMAAQKSKGLSKDKNKQHEQVQLDLELIDLTLNGDKIEKKEWDDHLRIADQVSLQALQNISSVPTSPCQSSIISGKIKLKFGTPTFASSSISQFKNFGFLTKQVSNNENVKKLYFLFQTSKLFLNYEYHVILNSQKYGQFHYKICYSYPMVQKMDQKILFMNSQTIQGQVSNMPSSQAIKMMANPQAKKKNKHLAFSIPFINKFNQNLQLTVKCTEPNYFIKILPSSVANNSTTPYTIEAAPVQKGVGNFNKIILNSFTKQSLNLQIICRPNIKLKSQFQIQLHSIKFQQLIWAYPITIFKVHEITKRPPILITGQARSPIDIKIHPLVAFRATQVQIVLQNQSNKQQKVEEILYQKEDCDESKVQLKVKQDVIRKRVFKQQSFEQIPKIKLDIAQVQPQPTSIQSRGDQKGFASQYLQNLISGDRHIPPHTQLNSQYVYEVQLQLTAACAIKAEGYFYVYQTKNNIQSKHISPASSEKQLLLNEASLYSDNAEKLTGLSVEKVPFILKLDPPKTEVLQFQANVGEKATIKIKLDALNSSKSNQSNSNKNVGVVSKVLDFICEPIKNEVKIELHNNKCRQFSAFYNEKQQCIEVTYFAQEYSGLKKGKLQIFVSGIYSQYDLIGKFPKNERNMMKRGSKTTNQEFFEK